MRLSSPRNVNFPLDNEIITISNEHILNNLMEKDVSCHLLFTFYISSMYISCNFTWKSRKKIYFVSKVHVHKTESQICLLFINNLNLSVIFQYKYIPQVFWVSTYEETMFFIRIVITTCGCGDNDPYKEHVCVMVGVILLSRFTIILKALFISFSSSKYLYEQFLCVNSLSLFHF